MNTEEKLTFNSPHFSRKNQTLEPPNSMHAVRTEIFERELKSGEILGATWHDFRMEREVSQNGASEGVKTSISVE